MALTPLQRDVCRLLADERRAHGESYVFHDTADAVARSWDRDRVRLTEAGYAVRVLRERPGYVEAAISHQDRHLVAEWARDSAFRFFPLVEHEDLGLTLHPFDLATNKVLALVGRAEAKDWVDVIACDERMQPLGYLAWAACGKDPGFTPQSILEQAQRSSRYSEVEVSALAFEGPPPTAADLSRRWHRSVETALAVIDRLPSPQVGRAVLTIDSQFFTGDITSLERAIAENRLVFHPGRIGGALPEVRTAL